MIDKFDLMTPNLHGEEVARLRAEIAELRETIKQDELGFGFMLDANRKLTAENAQLRADLEKCLHALDDEVMP